ncbi:MAG: ABC transporter permease [Cyclobacteriaceae bacterium]|nr:ABC transporter permease [Cyclobacteriaceae bacterium]
MLRNYFLVTLRSLSKKKLFVFINIIGMGLAVALSIVAYLNWDFRNRWDSDQRNAENIYRIQFAHDNEGQEDHYAKTPLPLSENIKTNISDVQVTARIIIDYTHLRVNEEVFSPYIFYADSSFFEMFDLALTHGDINSFKDKSKIFISDELALRYFNTEDVVGKPITQINNRIPKEFEIGGVFKKRPYNSSFRFDVITRWENQWDTYADHTPQDSDWKKSASTFVLIKDSQRVSVVAEQLQRYVEDQNKARPDLKAKKYYLQRFAGIQDARDLKDDDLWWGAPKAVVIIPAIMSALLLLLACFNFTNTSIALSSQRLKEISIRKVMGGLRKQLVVQFLGENLLLCLLGFAAGLFIAELLVPAYDSLWWWLDLDLSYTQNKGIFIFLFGLLLFTGLLAGSYPAFYITSFEPISILKGKTKFGGASWLTKTLLAGQFSISLVTIIFAIAFFHNAHYQQDFDLGFSKTGVISISVENESAFTIYRDALSGNEDIVKIAGTKDHIANSFYTGTVKYESMEKQVDIMDVGDDYLSALDIKILTGRGFSKDSQTDLTESVIITEEFIKRFGWTDNPIGKRVVWQDTAQFFVIGVTKDLYARSLFSPIEPMMIRYILPHQYTQLVASTAPGKMQSVDAFMKQKWQKLFPNLNYESQFIDNQMSDTNTTNKNVIIIFGFIGFFAGLLSFTGLFTLVSLTILKRTSEIGIRKILGASVLGLVHEISFEFVVVLGVASLLGGVIGYSMVDFSMDAAWEYYEKVGISTIITSIGAMLLLAALTTGFKTINAARMNPVKNLRTE